MKDKTTIAHQNFQTIYSWLETIQPEKFDGAPPHVLEALKNLRVILTPNEFEPIKKAFALPSHSLGIKACKEGMKSN